MKTIGLIGGMSWESSLEYYRIINETVKKKLGNSHSCKSIMYSVDFQEIEKLQHEGKWNILTEKMIKIAKKLENNGAELILICTNTMHKMADEIQNNIKIPLIHIADATANSIKKSKINKIGLLGTKFTMEGHFYKDRLYQKHNLEIIIPTEKERVTIHDIIYKELIYGIVSEESKEKYKKIIENLKNRGAEGIILGCTEIPLLIQEKDSSIPIFNTTKLHAEKAVEFAIK